MMDVPTLQYDFYNAYILESRVGPRREVTLMMELWPKVNGERIPWTPGRGEGPLVEVRFGGIENFAEVAAFFQNFAEGPNANCGLHYLVLEKPPISKPGRLFLEMEYDFTEARAKIQCQSVNVTPR